MTRLQTACYIHHIHCDSGCSMRLVMWHPFVTCGHCGQIHECVRLVSDPCSFTILCHGCEATLSVTVTAAQIAARHKKDAADQHFEVAGAATRKLTRWTEEHGVG